MNDAIAPTPPRQARSRASLERMLDAAEQLLRERGDDGVTLVEVARRGSVSIGSIYCRFSGKDALIHAVQARAMPELEARQVAAIARACEAGSVPELVSGLIDALAESLRDAAPILKPLMLRALADPVIAEAGKRSYAAIAETVHRGLMRRRGAMTHPDPDAAAAALFRIAYAAIARFLGFGVAGGEAGDASAWQALKDDLTVMGTALLMVRPACAQCWTQGPGARIAPVEAMAPA